MAIDVTRVRSVLLADGWHRVTDKSFKVETYEYAHGGAAGGNGAAAIVGFHFKDDAGYLLTGPLSAILATQASS